MGKQRQQFTLVLQRKKYWYIRYYDEQNIRRAISSGTSSKGAAHRIATEWYRIGLLGMGIQGTMTFLEYSRFWWTEKCPYVNSEKARYAEPENQDQKGKTLRWTHDAAA